MPTSIRLPSHQFLLILCAIFHLVLPAIENKFTSSKCVISIISNEVNFDYLVSFHGHENY